MGFGRHRRVDTPPQPAPGLASLVPPSAEHELDRSHEIQQELVEARRRHLAAQSRRDRVAALTTAFLRESRENHFVERLQLLHDDVRRLGRSDGGTT